MGNPNESRIVLLPQGPVQSEDGEIFTSLLFKLGADIDRFWSLPMIDPGKVELQKYIKYLQRSRLEHCSELGRAIVALTITNPPSMTAIPVRKQLEAAFPALRSALWVVWVDMRENPFIFSDLRKLGTIDDEVGPAPIWLEQNKRAYLILVPDCNNFDKLRARANDVLLKNVHYCENETITSKRRALLEQSRQPEPISKSSYSRPRSWTDRGNQPPSHSIRVRKSPQASEAPGRLERSDTQDEKPFDTGYRFASEYPTGSGTRGRNR